MPDSTLDDLDDFVASADTTNVLMAARAEEEDEAKPAFEVQRVGISEGLANRFQTIVRQGIANDAGEFHLRQYDLEYKLDDHELFYINLDDIPETKAQLDRIENVNQAEKFRRDAEFAERLAFYSIGIEDGQGRQATFYRKHSPKNVLANGFLARLIDRDYFEELETEVYLFDRQIDFFTFGNHLFINRAYDFRLVFKRFEQLQQQVEENVQDITNQVPIENSDDFLEACKKQPQMVSKVAHVASRPYLTEITFDDLRRTIDAFNLEVKITQDDQGNDQLVFESDFENRWTILKMLDDDYLGSVLTDRQYEVNSKVEHED